jgi:hypothetical protein
LNLRPLGYEPNELPDCSTPRTEIELYLILHPLSNVTKAQILHLKPKNLVTGYRMRVTRKKLKVNIENFTLNFLIFASGGQGGLFLKKPPPLAPPQKLFIILGCFLVFLRVTLCIFVAKISNIHDILLEPNLSPF